MNRGLAVCLALRDAGWEARLLSNSPFARGLAGLARCPVVGMRPEEVESYVARSRPAVLVMDTFAQGLRGERPRARAMVHVARRLLRPVAVEVLVSAPSPREWGPFPEREPRAHKEGGAGPAGARRAPHR